MLGDFFGRKLCVAKVRVYIGGSALVLEAVGSVGLSPATNRN